MAQLNTKPITSADLIEYLTRTSDFSFELSVLKTLAERGLQCEHGGTYIDKATGKTREFDIRAMKSVGNSLVRMAIECKNVRDYFPILVSCVPRHDEEAYHEISLVVRDEPESSLFSVAALQPRGRTLRLRKVYSLYPPNEMVGKSTSQVGRVRHDNSIVENDSDIFEKWSQCVSSAEDLAQRLDEEPAPDDEEAFRLSMLIPIVVVPDGRLWSVPYAVDGTRLADPTCTSRVSCFIGREYEISRVPGQWIRVSHIELMTPTGLSDFIASALSTPEVLFAPEGLKAAVEQLKEEYE